MPERAETEHESSPHPSRTRGGGAQLDSTGLAAALAEIHYAGMPGVFAEVNAGQRVWRAACGVADVATGRPATPDLRHRIGSITKTFTVAAVLRLVEQGWLRLDSPISRYLPGLVPGQRGDLITVRMLANHTSGLAEYLPYAYPSLKAFPSLPDVTPESLEDNRFRRFAPTELIELGVAAPAAGAPGSTPGVYSNTNYLLLGQLLERLTGTTAEDYITREVIQRAGLDHTAFPAEPRLTEPHSRLYEAWFGQLDPPRDYSVYDMSWVRTAADLVSTVGDLNRFFGLLFAGEIVGHSSLAQMQRTVPVRSFEGTLLDYGLGLQRFVLPGRGTVWGNEGTVWGAGATSMISADGSRRLSVALNLMRWNTVDADGKPRHHPIDAALRTFYRRSMWEQASRRSEQAGRR